MSSIKYSISVFSMLLILALTLCSCQKKEDMTPEVLVEQYNRSSNAIFNGKMGFKFLFGKVFNSASHKPSRLLSENCEIV